MKQWIAVEAITESLKKDKRVKSIFLKGSMGRGEEDEFSDVDLYCLVEQGDLASFVQDRLRHLEAYGKLLFHDDLFIIAPQIIAVYEDLLHIDLFTVTEKTFKQKDYFKVIYDPEDRLSPFARSQNLLLSDAEFNEFAGDTGWFLFQYLKAMRRGNDLWAAEMLQHTMRNFSSVLLQRYNPDRAQLGFKTLEASLPEEHVGKVKKIMGLIGPFTHQQAADEILMLIEAERNWIRSVWLDEPGNRLLDTMLRTLGAIRK
ncbi:DNA polymerase III subunit beta [Rossellomorea marisflavi]|uniref:DNA polymerase III subunit beta n=1 Tax=Rossellomorea marisflavi TaxID=189381 RepID=A0A0M0GQ00_9BACI|nr:aminoglycoside 6-adenylyltransferase [Rossellomorea marisflavi]KON91934.1 DNA polymerase III subunit beta [Rossellomorea marisflavi]